MKRIGLRPYNYKVFGQISGQKKKPYLHKLTDIYILSRIAPPDKIAGAMSASRKRLSFC